MITLLDGRSVDPDKIVYDETRLSFVLMGETITNLIRRADKVSIWNIDVDRENARIYAESYARDHDGALPKDLNTNTADIFFQQIVEDPLAAPLGALNRAVDRFIAAPAITKILIIGGIAIGVTLLVKAVKESH